MKTFWKIIRRLLLTYACWAMSVRFFFGLRQWHEGCLWVVGCVFLMIFFFFLPLSVWFGEEK